jgi:hypothetical protein
MVYGHPRWQTICIQAVSDSCKHSVSIVRSIAVLWIITLVALTSAVNGIKAVLELSNEQRERRETCNMFRALCSCLPLMGV